MNDVATPTTTTKAGKGFFKPTAFSYNGIVWKGRGRFPVSLKELMVETGKVPRLVDGVWSMEVPETDREKALLSASMEYMELHKATGEDIDAVEEIKQEGA